MLKELKTHHREIARLRFEGFKPTEIAERTGTKLQTIYNILRDALCKSYMAGLSDKAHDSVINVRKKMAEMNKNALETIYYMLEDSNRDLVPASTRLTAANSILDRNGYAAPERHEHMVAHFTSEDLLALKERAESVNIDYLDITPDEER